VSLARGVRSARPQHADTHARRRRGTAWHWASDAIAQHHAPRRTHGSAPSCARRHKRVCLLVLRACIKPASPKPRGACALPIRAHAGGWRRRAAAYTAGAIVSSTRWTMQTSARQSWQRAQGCYCSFRAQGRLPASTPRNAARRIPVLPLDPRAAAATSHMQPRHVPGVSSWDPCRGHRRMRERSAVQHVQVCAWLRPRVTAPPSTHIRWAGTSGHGHQRARAPAPAARYYGHLSK
jgi:hypothetical protein